MDCIQTILTVQVMVVAPIRTPLQLGMIQLKNTAKSIHCICTTAVLPETLKFPSAFRLTMEVEILP